jgi:hypothetical protein
MTYEEWAKKLQARYRGGRTRFPIGAVVRRVNGSMFGVVVKHRKFILSSQFTSANIKVQWAGEFEAQSWVNASQLKAI